MVLVDTFARLSAKKAALDAARPLPAGVVAKLREALDVEWTYHTNAIEGSTLTLAETALVVRDGLTVGGKTLREHLEAINHQHAIAFVEDLAGHDAPITEHTIRQVHALVLRTIDDENAGRYRRVAAKPRLDWVRITGSEYVPPEAIAVPGLMADLVAWLGSPEAEALHPVEQGALAHFRLVDIHPFVDGNGRTARLLMNLVLLRAGYPPAIIRLERRLAYYNTLELAHAGDTELFVALVAEAEEQALDVWLEAAEPSVEGG